MLRDFLLKHSSKDPVSFHMPGHKGKHLYEEYGYMDFIEEIPGCDITEIPGADNLFQAEDVILSVMKRYERLYETKASYLLINGTSGGLIASILASVPKGGKLIMARNCHKSVFNALNLGSLTPAYLYPEMSADGQIMGEVKAEAVREVIEKNMDASAVIVTSPNYYGICSDIKAIADICHAYGKTLIVDQAHGAHLKFFHKYGYGEGMPMAAEDAGADLVVNSTHKTLASFTQTAVLNVCSDRVDLDILEDKLQVIESSSPSYILMTSLEINAEIMEEHGKKLIGQWRENLDWFYGKARSLGIPVFEAPGLDDTKMNINLGISGSILEEKLMERGIFTELNTGNILMCMSGIGNRREDFEKLLAALCEIKEGSEEGLDGEEERKHSWNKERMLYPVPEKRKKVLLSEAEGMICAAGIIPYPPGIPYLCPGERIEREDIDYLLSLRERGDKVVGINEEGKVICGNEDERVL